jgi:hypothetical protein
MTTQLDARATLRGLVGREIATLTGKPNRVIGLTADDVIVGTRRSPGGQPVPIEEVQHALDLLARDGAVEVSVATVGYRSAFIGAVLATLPDVEVSTRPREVRFRGSSAVQSRGGGTHS